MSQTFAQLINGKSATVEFSTGSASTPSVAFSGDTNTGIYSPGADQVAISTNGSGRLFVDASGRVGIGATPASVNFEVSQSGTSSAADVLRIYNRTDGTGTGYLGFPKYGSAASAYGPYSANNVGINATFTQLNVGTETSHALVAYTNNTERLRITSAGLVGIGDSAPVSTLTVRGTGGSIAGINTHVLVSDSTAMATGVGGSILFEGAYSTGGDRAVYAAIAGTKENGTNFNYAGNLKFYTRSGSALPSVAMTIDSSQRVGIGTASPATPLHVNSGAISTGARLESSSTGAYLNFANSSGNSVYIGASTSAFYVETGGSERARIDSNGQLAIGTTGVPNTPRLGVKGNNNLASGQAVIPSTYCGVVISSSSGGSVDNGGALWFDHGDLFSGIAGSRVSTGNWGTDLRFYTHPDSTTNQYTLPERMRITSAGNVFIGATSYGAAGWTTNNAGALVVQYSSTSDIRTLYEWKSDNAGANTTAAYIQSDGKIYARTTTVQAISSERRLKENIVPLEADNAWETIKSVPFYSYNFIGADPSNVLYGPMADEVPDEMRVATSQSDDVGVIHTYDNGMLQARLYVALQAALNKIEALEAKVAALESA